MNDALIGYTGFVGSNLLSQHQFKHLYNSKNIDQINEKKFDQIVSCGTPSLVWKANLAPEEDWQVINSLIKHLTTVEADRFVLISTIFVYPNPYDVDEESQIDPKLLMPYGLNRYRLEKFVRSHFKNHLIVRLPNLFGPGIKKNFIYDLMFNNRLDLTHKDSRMQWYNLKNIWRDIQIALHNDLATINFAVEPLVAKKIAKYCLGIDFTTVTEKAPLNHKMLTKYGVMYGKTSHYLYDGDTILEDLKEFVKK